MKTYDELSDAAKIDSLLVALVFMSSPITVAFQLGLGIHQNGNLAIIGIMIILFFMKFIMGLGEIKMRLDVVSQILLLLVILLFVLTKFYSDEKSVYSITQLVFYAIIPIFCINMNFNTELVCRYSLYMSVFLILGTSKWFEYQYSYMNQANMGRIYPLMTVLIIAMFHFRFYRKNTTLFIKLLYLYNLYMLIRMLMVANRGAVLCIISTIFVLMLYGYNESTQSMERLGAKSIALLILGTIAVIVIRINMASLLRYFSILSSQLFDYVPSVLIKMERYMEKGDIGDGRNVVYEAVFNGITESPIYGHGMMTFKAITGMAFPHNYILQYLFEGGILFATVPILLSVKIVLNVLLGAIRERNKYVIAAMLVCQCIPKLLLSTDVWLGNIIWMMIAFSGILIDKGKFGADTRLIK